MSVELRTASVAEMTCIESEQQVKHRQLDIDGVVRVTTDSETQTVAVLVTETVETDQLQAAIESFQR